MKPDALALLGATRPLLLRGGVLRCPYCGEEIEFRPTRDGSAVDILHPYAANGTMCRDFEQLLGKLESASDRSIAAQKPANTTRGVRRLHLYIPGAGADRLPVTYCRYFGTARARFDATSDVAAFASSPRRCKRCAAAFERMNHKPLPSGDPPRAQRATGAELAPPRSGLLAKRLEGNELVKLTTEITFRRIEE